MNQKEPLSPLKEYQSRLNARTVRLGALELEHRRYGNGRVLLFVATVALGWCSYGLQLFAAYWLFLPVATFVIISLRHDGIIKNLNLARRAVAEYKLSIQRVAGNWAGRGSAGSRFRSMEHLYSEDLDLFGPASLFELMCAAKTRAGEDRLATWLQQAASPEVIRARQAAVQELKDRVDLREAIAVLGPLSTDAADVKKLTGWAETPLTSSSPGVIATARAITVITVAAGIYAAMGFVRVPFEVMIGVGILFSLYRRSSNAAAAAHLETNVRSLEILAGILKRLEKEQFQSAALQHISALLGEGSDLASHRIEGLVTIAGLREALNHQLVAMVVGPLLWRTHTSFALERWRLQNGERITRWIEAIAEFEALNSLAQYAYELPAGVFPEISDSGALFEAVQLYHPLLPKLSAIPNDIRIDSASRLYIVSGSNMSGKSTLLRTIGINTVLALAGAPVCADSLRISVMQIGASLRTGDSLQAGVSRFYAEITRLRQIVEVARSSPPALFLLDEILHGTNSHDRTVGAEAVMRALLSAGAVGLVTTHDLALAQIAEDDSLQAVNVHLQDELVDGKMSFDYRLQPGVVTKSNAIPLMRAVGLEV